MRANLESINEGQEWGDLLVEREQFPAGFDATPLLKGLPNDLCPCPHWGHIRSGVVIVRYADHEETLRAGDAFYMAPGHTVVVLEDTEMFELSPAKELAAVMEVVGANAAALGIEF